MKLAPLYGALDFDIPQGATFALPLTWQNEDGTPVNLTGYTARMQIRAKLEDAAFLLELTTGNARIVLTVPASGKFELRLTAAETAALTWTRGVYDLDLVSSGGAVTRLVSGIVRVSPEVTR